MEDEREPSASVEGQQNLNDLQSYLVHFNKEIGNNGGSNYQQKFISQMMSVTSSEKSTPSEEELPALSDDKGTGSEPIISDELSEGQITLSEVGGTKFEVMDELSSVNSDIVELSASAISSLVDESHTPSEIEGLQGIMGSGNVMMIPVSNASNIMAQGGQKLVQIVNINGTPTLQVVNTDTQLPSAEVLPAPQVKALVESIALAQTSVTPLTVDTSTPLAVVTSAATNTNVSQILDVPLTLPNVNPVQLVAVRSATDTTQPQLVAVEAQDGSILGVTNVSQPTVLTSSVPAVATDLHAVTMATPIVTVAAPANTSNVQAVTPTLQSVEGTQLPLDGSYILIVNASGEKDQSRVYDFGENLRGDVVEEIVEPDGTSKRLVRITQLAANRDSPTVSAGPFGDQLMCSYCSYTTTKRYLLSRHLKSHSEDRPHKCTICQRGFKSMASLQNHVNVHMGVRPHKCKSCDSEFTTSGELVRHIRYKHTFEKPHKCTECDYASVELSKLKRHIRMHTGERPYQCTHCDYASPDTYKLKRHLRTHTGEKPYECDICHTKFTQSNSLKAHKLIHSGNKPVFQCEFCPTTCGRKTDLKIHIQKLHASDTPQLCKKCGASFPDRYHFKVHMKTHEGEKCFKCNLCDYAAVTPRHLQIHQMTHSGEKPYKCDECPLAFRQKQLLLRHKTHYHFSNMSAEDIVITAKAIEEEQGDEEQECAACLKIYEKYKNISSENQTIEEDESEEMMHTCGTVVKPVSSFTADQLIENSLLADMKDGKLGTSPKVVVVHPDGRIEEVTAKLQSLSQSNSKPVDDFLISLGVTGESQFDNVSQMTVESNEPHIAAVITSDVTGNEHDTVQSASNQSATTENQSPKTEIDDQSTPGFQQHDVQSTPSGDQSVEVVAQSDITADRLLYTTTGDEGTNQLIINIDQKEAGTQATFDSEAEEEKVIVSQGQPQIITITEVQTDSGLLTGSGDATVIVTRDDPSVKPVYVSILQKHDNSIKKELEGENPAKRLKLIENS